MATVRLVLVLVHHHRLRHAMPPHVGHENTWEETSRKVAEVMPCRQRAANAGSPLTLLGAAAGTVVRVLLNRRPTGPLAAPLLHCCPRLPKPAVRRFAT